ncbi:venom allergen 5 [Drosophila persimilis]|uniref:venom allergen 5 n=1 Tax=Drosophila persimilis TaxID=7234 RepID=UPI000F092FDC|nr:venom allergen 5 [Drosophila persimilis]
MSVALGLSFILCGLCLLQGVHSQSQANSSGSSISSTGSTIDYCQPGLCPQMKKHIACRNNGNFGSQCPINATELLNITNYQGLIVSEHNALRNVLAGGKVHALLPMPDRMASLQWHPELEYLATVSVKHCALLHDPCINTRQFPQAGQNLALIHLNFSLPEENRTDEVLIKESIAEWWSQSANVTADRVQKFPRAKQGVFIRNFAVMARDNNTFVGCAALRFVRRKVEPDFLMACNYASNYAVDHPIYREKALGCQAGTDPKYPPLCRTGEQYLEAAPMENATRHSFG